MTLIQGETGTAKRSSPAPFTTKACGAAAPFVKLNCAAIPATLLESELFGHERGAFTGAFAQTKGDSNRRTTGRSYLTKSATSRLSCSRNCCAPCRNRSLSDLGSGRTIRVDVRVVAATDQDLAQLVSARQFRADLYYRLNVIPIFLPPLRSADDIPQFRGALRPQVFGRLNKAIDVIPEEVMEFLESHDWPGNIRELQNFIERAVVLSPGPVLRPDLPVLKQFTKRRHRWSRVHLPRPSGTTFWRC